VFTLFWGRVLVPYSFRADPELGFEIFADPDPGFEIFTEFGSESSAWFFSLLKSAFFYVKKEKKTLDLDPHPGIPYADSLWIRIRNPAVGIILN